MEALISTFVVGFTYFLLGFLWVYLHYKIYDRQLLNELSAFLLIIFWPISFIVSLPHLYKLLRRKLNI
mgnify:CR=1 FL=1